MIESANFYEFGINSVFQKLVAWLYNQILCGIRSHKEDLRDKKPGAAPHRSTKIIWVKMFNRPMYFNHPNKNLINILAVRRKFNTVLENFLALSQQEVPVHIMSIENLNDQEHFDFLGNLNHIGKFQFWRIFGYLMKKFDRGSIQLKPVHERDGFKLPPPPLHKY